MIVVCRPATKEVSVRESETLTSFHVEAPQGTPSSAVSKALGTPEADKEGHVWVLIEQLRELAGETTADWNTGFEAMIGYAASKGWTNDAGDMLLAHVEAA